MKRLAVAAVAASLYCVLSPSGGALLSATGDAHGYFNALIERGDHWKSFSLRPQQGYAIGTPHYEKQLARPKDGGYANANSGELWVTYDPAHDADPNRQDAAKVIIPAFTATTTLATAISSTQTRIPLTVASSSLWGNGRGLKIGNEIMTVVRVSGVALTDNSVDVIRGQSGTTASEHAVGATVSASGNSLANQVRLPLGTADGNTYLFTWDGYWTSSYLNTGLTNHKAFQFTSGGDALWLEPQTRFDGGSASAGGCEGWNPSRHVAGLEMRSYHQYLNGGANWSSTDGNTLGPGITSKEPIQPKQGSFCLAANRWTRFWVRIEQRVNDYDYMDMWAADESTDPVQIYNRVPLSVRPSGTPANSILKFWLEYNTSTSEYTRGGLRDLVSYIRNFASLRNPPTDVRPLLLRPLAGTPPPYTGPAPSTQPQAPTNFRVIGG